MLITHALINTGSLNAHVVICVYLCTFFNGQHGVLGSVLQFGVKLLLLK